MVHSFGLFVALKQRYLAEIYRISKFLPYEGKFNRVSVAVITCLVFGKQDQGITCFLFSGKKRLIEKEENYYSLFIFFSLNLCVKWI